MAKHNPANERIKRQYLIFLAEAKRQSAPTVDAAAKAIHRFEEYMRYRDFKAFHFEQAVGFKRNLAESRSVRSGEILSKATIYATLRTLRAFFQWLAYQPGFRSTIRYSDAEYFNLSEKDTRIATALREQSVPTLEQIKYVISTVGAKDEISRRNQALLAFTLLTGARDSAIASMKLKHVDLKEGSVFQDAREVKTKASKTILTDFFPVGEEVARIVVEWIDFLRTEKLWGNDDPLFPATAVTIGAEHQFTASGLDRAHWQTSSPIRQIFKQSFNAAGLPYFTPHSFRKTLVGLGEQICISPEQFKAWSQNLGHEQVLMTLNSYGSVSRSRQKELMWDLATRPERRANELENLVEAVAVLTRITADWPTLKKKEG